MTKKDLRHATVVVTGATSGIGRAIALEFAKQGSNLILAARSESNLVEMTQECMRLGAHAIYVPTDTTDGDAVEALAARAVEKFGGRIDVWVNDAGIGTVGDFSETPLDAHVQVVKTNLIGYMNGCHAALRYMKEQKSGTIINMNSLGAWLPLPYASGYSASKFGLLGFMEALRGELANEPDIHVCDIYPVCVDTPGFRHAGNFVGATLKAVPPVVSPELVAETAIRIARSPRDQTTIGWPIYAGRAVYAAFPKTVRNLTGFLFREYFAVAYPAPLTEGSIFETKPEHARVSGGRGASPDISKPLMIGAAGLALGLGFMLAQKKIRASKGSQAGTGSDEELEGYDRALTAMRMQGTMMAQT